MVHKIVKNLTWLTFGNFLVKPIWFVFITYVCIRYLGIRQYGTMTAAVALMSIIDGILTMGSSTYSIKEIARDRELTGLFFSNFLPFRIVASVLAITIGLAIELAIGNSTIIATVVFAGTYTLTRNLTEYCRVIFKAHEVFKLEAVSTIIEKILVVSIGSVFLFVTPTASSVLLGMTIGMLVTFFVNYRWVVSRFATVNRLLMNLTFLKEAMPKAAPLGLASIFVLLYFRTDSIMIEAFKGELATGQYAMAFRITEALLILPSMVATVLLPRLSSLFSGDDDRFRIYSRNSVFILSFVSLVVAALIYALAPVIIHSMESSSDSAPAIHLLRVLIWAFPLSGVNYVLSTTLIAGDLQKRLALVLGLAALLNIGLNLVMIPSMSALGAAYATIITQFFVIVFFSVSLASTKASLT